MKRVTRKKAAIGAGTALAAAALAFVMLGVGNVPSYSSQATCGAGQPCTPASVTTGTGTFNVVDAGAVYTSVLTTPVVDAGTVIVATGNNLCLDGPTCSVAIMNNTGQMVFSAPVAGGRFPGSLTAQGTTTLGSAFADYITIVGAAEGNGTTITAASSGANSPITITPKGAGKLVTTGVTATVSASSFAAGTQIDSRLLVMDNNGGNQQACLWGSKALSGGSGAVTFGTAFSQAPYCDCTHVNTTNSNACVISSAGTPTTTGVTFSVTSGGTDVIHWRCCGDK